MTHHEIFPTKDSDYNVYFNIVVAYLTANQLRLGINALDIAALAALLITWNNVYPASTNPATATGTINDQKNVTRKDGEALLRKVYNDIPNSALILDDRNTLHLEEHDTNPTHAAKPTVAPTVTVERLGHGYHVLRFQNPETPDSHAKPVGVASIEVYSVVMDHPKLPEPGTIPQPGGGAAPGAGGSTPAVDPESLLHHVASTGRFLVTVDYILNQVGLRAFYVARYKNTRGEFGPYSVPVNALVN